MIRTLTAVRALSRLGVWVGGFLLFGASFFIGIDVLLRKLFAISISGANELSQYALAISTAFALSYALFHKAHIRVDVLYSRLSDRAQSFLDLLSLVMMLLFMGPLSYYAFGVFQTSLERDSMANTPLATPLWIPQGLWALGLAFFTFTVALILIATARFLLRGDLIAAQELASATTMDEEIEVESGIRVVEDVHDR